MFKVLEPLLQHIFFLDFFNPEKFKKTVINVKIIFFNKPLKSKQ